MVKYRRNKPQTTDAIFFITAVTYQRTAILHDRYELYLRVIDRVKSSLQFELFAFAVMPEHFHFLILPKGSDYSKIIYSIKRGFSAELKRQNTIPRQVSCRATKYWQDRFWEHTIRSDGDLIRHTDYIHYNPVKHGLVENPHQWPHSSFLSFVERGIYPISWGALMPENIASMDLE